MEERQDIASTEVSKGTFASSGERKHALPKRSCEAQTTVVTAAPFSAKQVYFTVSAYAVLLAGSLWASINLLNWFWHKLL